MTDEARRENLIISNDSDQIGAEPGAPAWKVEPLPGPVPLRWKLEALVALDAWDYIDLWLERPYRPSFDEFVRSRLIRAGIPCIEEVVACYLEEFELEVECTLRRIEVEVHTEVREMLAAIHIAHLVAERFDNGHQKE